MMNKNDKEFIGAIENVIDDKMKQYFERYMKHSSTEISNENGTASILKSGNSIVYIDNSGLAYSMLLFFYQMMSEQDKKGMDIDEVLGKIEERMSRNRKSFEELISSLQDSKEE